MIEAVLTLVAATLLLLGSPGPVPVALAATGASFGVKKGTPFLLGTVAGLSVVIFGATAGLTMLFSTWPGLELTAQTAGALYIVYLAYKICTSPVIGAKSITAASAPSFWDGFILNVINPKAYAVFLAIFSRFLLPLQTEISGYLATSVICLLVAFIVDILWLGFGGLISPVFCHPRYGRMLRIVLAGLMVVAVAEALF